MAKHMVYHLQIQPNKTFKAAQKVGVTQVAWCQLSKHKSTEALEHRSAASGETFVSGLDSHP